MNRKELKDRLVAAGVPESYYFIFGIDSQQSPGKGGGFGELVLTRADDGEWRLVTEEQGQVRSDRRFGTEAEACEETWQDLQSWNRPVRQRTPLERERALERSRQVQAEGGVTPGH